MHHSEGVNDQVSGLSVGDRRQAPINQQVQPRASMGTGELDHPASTGEPSGCLEALDSVYGLCDESFRLRAKRLLGHNRFADELCQAAGGAQPHLERVGRVGSLAMEGREMITGGLVAQVQHHFARLPCARATGVTTHRDLLSTGKPATLASRLSRLATTFPHRATPQTCDTRRGRASGQPRKASARADAP